MRRTKSLLHFEFNGSRRVASCVIIMQEHAISAISARLGNPASAPTLHGPALSRPSNPRRQYSGGCRLRSCNGEELSVYRVSLRQRIGATTAPNSLVIDAPAIQDATWRDYESCSRADLPAAQLHIYISLCRRTRRILAAIAPDSPCLAPSEDAIRCAVG
jgi:hypothetical protein